VRGAAPEFLEIRGFELDMPWAAKRWLLARWAGVHPKDIDALDWGELLDLQATIDGYETAREHEAIRASER